MAKGKKPAAKTGKLVAHNFLPTLSKPAHVLTATSSPCRARTGPIDAQAEVAGWESRRGLAGECLRRGMRHRE